MPKTAAETTWVSTVLRLEGALADQRDEADRQQHRHRDGQHGGERGAATTGSRVLAVGSDRGAGEHQREEHEHDDGADVDEHQDQGDQLGTEDE